MRPNKAETCLQLPDMFILPSIYLLRHQYSVRKFDINIIIMVVLLPKSHYILWEIGFPQTHIISYFSQYNLIIIFNLPWGMGVILSLIIICLRVFECEPMAEMQ